MVSSLTVFVPRAVGALSCGCAHLSGAHLISYFPLGFLRVKIRE